MLNIDLLNSDIIESGFNVMSDDIKKLQEILSFSEKQFKKIYMNYFNYISIYESNLYYLTDDKKTDYIVDYKQFEK